MLTNSTRGDWMDVEAGGHLNGNQVVFFLSFFYFHKNTDILKGFNAVLRVVFFSLSCRYLTWPVSDGGGERFAHVAPDAAALRHGSSVVFSKRKEAVTLLHVPKQRGFLTE